MIDITSASATSTATVCENMALYGATPERGELDSRVVWDEDDATGAMSEAIRIMVGGVTVDGTQMADEREPLMWGLVNMLHSQVRRLDRAVDRIVPEMKDLQTAQDGSEVKAPRARAAGRQGPKPRRPQRTPSRRCATSPQTPTAQRPETHGARATDRTSARPARSPPPPSTPATSSVRGRTVRTRAHLPEGTLVAIAGGKIVSDADAVWSTLDRARAKHGDMVLVHGGGAGVEKVAAKLGRGQRRRPGRLPPRLDRAWQGRALPPQRRPPEPDAERCHRFPRLGHHRQPRRQGTAARHSRARGRRLMRRLSPLEPVVAAAAIGPTHFSPCLLSRIAARHFVPAPLALPSPMPTTAALAHGSALRAIAGLATCAPLAGCAGIGRRPASSSCTRASPVSGFAAHRRPQRCPRSCRHRCYLPCRCRRRCVRQRASARVPAVLLAPPIAVPTFLRRACTVDDEVTSAPPTSALQGTCERSTVALKTRRLRHALLRCGNMCAAPRCSEEHVRPPPCAEVTNRSANRTAHRLRCAMCEECPRELAPRAPLCYLGCRDDNVERAWRSQPGPLALSPQTPKPAITAGWGLTASISNLCPSLRHSRFGFHTPRT